MKQTNLFTKTLHDAPKDETAKNAQLLIRAGFVHKEMAGVYDLLPLGFRVVENIKQIVREEMEGIGATELLMSSMQNKNTWTGTDRWDDKIVDVWFKSKLHAGGEVGFGWSHEEPITQMMTNHIASYKDLPVYVYQFQNKLRNELRAKAGVMRGREFLMKDMYSYSADKETHEKFYEATKDAYVRVFARLGLGSDTFVTFADGGAFTKFSHEFQTVCTAGEDVVYINREKGIAINEEVLNNETLSQLGVTEAELEKVVTAEVGNIFNFGTEKCEQMDLYFTNSEGEKTPAFLGSYGIGITRLLGVIAEKFSDENGLVWPENIAPFSVHLISINADEEAQELYSQLKEKGVAVLWDDRDARPGQKFADSDLIGIPHRVVISPKTIEQGGLEIKMRSQDNTAIVSIDAFLKSLVQ